MLPAVIAGLALSVILLQNLVHSLLCLIGLFIATTFVYLGAGVEYLAFVFLIVYVGAVSILFLFVIMLINIRATVVSYFSLPLARRVVMVLMLGLAVLLLVRFSYVLDLFIFTTDCLQVATESATGDSLVCFISVRFMDILIFSVHLFVESSYLVFLIALLLLTALLGAISLAIYAMDVSDNQ